jgi:eukaryotic-like serine/threonine-protein kinase
VNRGDLIGPYLVVEPLGTGGMGEVYRARDTRLAREVALKRLFDPALGSESGRRHVLREARAAAALSHPNIATIYDVLETPDGLVIVMEYVPGETLAARLLRGPLSLDDALRFGGQIADALSDAHDHGVIHRDLKPANVHLTPDGKAKILDFGIAKVAVDPAAPDTSAAETVSRANQIVGTPGYMAPEQLAGGRGDQRTDIYGLGLLLFEMLTGKRPFKHSDIVGNALAVFEGRAPQARAVAPHVPAEVSDLVARAMARNPDDRFSTARALAAAIHAAQRGVESAETATLEGPVPPRRGWMQHRTAIGAVILLAALAGGLLWFQPWTTPVSAHSSVIGVLPFRNGSGDARNDPLVVGLSDAVAKRLGSVRSLRVLPLDETREAWSGTKASGTVARTLGAAFVVEGTVQRRGETLDVDMVLVGADGQPRPAGRYSGDITQLFELHRRVVEGVTAVLQQQGAGGGSEPQAGPPTSDADAFADYAQAKVFLERPDVPGSLQHAIDLLHSAIARDKNFALAHAALGEAYWAQFRETQDASWTVKAQAANLEALRIDRDQPEVHMALAVMYEGLGQADKATEELRQVLALQPRSDNAHLVLSRIHGDKGQWDAAVAEANAAIALRPNYWRNHAQLGDILLRAGRLDGAIAAYTRFTQLQPDSARGYQRLGTALQAAGRIDEAMDSYQKVNDIRESWAAYSNIGTIHYWRGDNAKAIAAYERAIVLAPNRPDLYANLGDVLRKTGQSARAADNYRRAIVEARKALSVNANDPLSVAGLALYQAKLGLKDAAASSIELASTLSPQDGEVLYVRAVVHALAGNTSAACEATGAALAHGKSAEEVRRADELKSLKGCPAYDRLLAPAK